MEIRSARKTQLGGEACPAMVILMSSTNLLSYKYDNEIVLYVFYVEDMRKKKSKNLDGFFVLTILISTKPIVTLLT